MSEQDEDKPGVLSWAITAASLAAVGVMLFEVATDSSRAAPLLDLIVFIAVMIAGIVFIVLLFGVLAGKEIDDEDALDNPSWPLRAKVAFAYLSGIAAMVGVLYIYMFWLTG